MPTYAYRCSACAHEFETFQKFSDDPLKECPECGSEIRRVIHPVGIVFKGSGWYVTDSRPSAEKSDSTTPGESKPSEPKGDAAPAATSSKTETPAPAKVAAD